MNLVKTGWGRGNNVCEFGGKARLTAIHTCVTVGCKIVFGGSAMSLTGTTSIVISNISYSTVLSFDGDTFDANQVGYGTAVLVNGTYSLYYAGLSFSNAKELGLATSTDSIHFSRYSNDPIVSPAQEPWFASFRLLPSTVLYENGTYKMWFFGIDSNLLADANQTTGWGYATSSNGVDWSFGANPIRSETGSYQGDQLIEVVKLGDKYLSYYIDVNGSNYAVDNKYYVAFSTDGINFTGDTEFTTASGPQMVAATSYGSTIISVWSDAGHYYSAYSTNGVDFTRVASIDLPPNVGPSDMTIVGNNVIVWTEKYEGPGSWGFGTTTIGQFELSIDSFLPFTPPLDAPVTILGENGNGNLIGGNNADIISGGNGNDTIFGAEGNDRLFGDNGADRLFGGAGNDFLHGGNGNDTIQGGSGNDTMWGGNGSDRFVFVASESLGDRDTISDYRRADKIVLTGFGHVNAASLTVTQTGADTTIAVHSVDSSGHVVSGLELDIILLGVRATTVNADSFIF
jgi:Ca2+-binding RTX toxin-like protein